MAQVTTRKVVEGLNNLVLHVFMESDGLSGELDNYVLLSPADLIPPLPATKPTFRIMRVWYSMVWFDITFKYGGLQPRPVWTLARDAANYLDFRSFGGISDYGTEPPSDQTGKLLISTNGFAAAGSQGSMTIEFRKP
jgi:hypothetical protein